MITKLIRKRTQKAYTFSVENQSKEYIVNLVMSEYDSVLSESVSYKGMELEEGEDRESILDRIYSSDWGD